MELSVALIISIHTPYAGSDQGFDDKAVALYTISIHTPYAGSDVLDGAHIVFDSISIHTPYAGSDSPSRVSIMMFCLFQSTLPMQGVTLALV